MWHGENCFLKTRNVVNLSSSGQKGSSFFQLKRFASLQKEERLRASTHETIHLWEKQNQRGLSVPCQDPSSACEEEEDAEAIKNHYQRELQGDEASGKRKVGGEEEEND